MKTGDFVMLTEETKNKLLEYHSSKLLEGAGEVMPQRMSEGDGSFRRVRFHSGYVDGIGYYDDLILSDEAVIIIDPSVADILRIDI